MRKAGIAFFLGLFCLLSSCASGPHQLQRTIDDWDGQIYTDSPWLNAALHIVPVIPLARFATGFADFLVTDAYFFWFKDAWDGKGTGFKHKEILGSDGHVESLLISSSKWLEVKN